MFACPHCQFENPTQNRFCQRCGKALKGLRAVIMAAGSGQAETTADLAEAATTEAIAAGSPLTVAHLVTADQQYLKGEKRYQLRQPTAAAQPLTSEVILDVIDCQPAAVSPFEQLLESVVSDADDLEAQDFDHWLPDKAFPYWKLQEHFFPMVPELQATWEAGDYTVVVLEDRSTWRTLGDLSHTADIEPLELVHWFYEIVNLWAALVDFAAEPSLLEPDNLRVDDDQILCVQRLIYKAGDRTYSIKDLGLFWRALLQQFTAISIPALDNLAMDIGLGTLTNVATIKEHLATIADNLQSDFTAAGAEVVTAPAAASGLPDVASFPVPLMLKENEGQPLLSMDELLLEDDLEDDEPEAEGGLLEEGLNDLPTMALPMRLYRLDEVGRTHVGRQRAHNEDSFFAETHLQRTDSPVGSSLKAKGLYILCDGMGGHSGGEVASALAVNTLREFFLAHWQHQLPDEATLKAGILQANQAIFDQNEAEGRLGSARMGTTLVMVLIADEQAVVAHVGDSRLYRLDRNGLSQITVDHEVGQREINRGVEPAIAYARPDAYQLTQALGPRSNQEVAPTVNTLPITQDTLFLLCSDGLSDNDLLETYVESHLEPMLRSRYDLEEGVAQLIDLANEHNGHDNITAIAIRVKMRPHLDALPGATQSLLGP